MTAAESESSRSFVAEHVRLFNTAVETGGWDAFVRGFAETARLEFVGPPVGPFVGRDAIYRAYVENPPDDTITAGEPVAHEDVELVVPYTWMTTGATGTMRFSRSNGLITRLVITFDPEPGARAEAT